MDPTTYVTFSLHCISGKNACVYKSKHVWLYGDIATVLTLYTVFSPSVCVYVCVCVCVMMLKRKLRVEVSTPNMDFGLISETVTS